MLKYGELVPAVMLVLNVLACGYFEREILASESAISAFYLVQGGILSSILFGHGSVLLGGIVDRARFLGVPRRLRFGFVGTEFSAHPVALAQLASLLLVWITLFIRTLPALLLIILATVVWYAATVACTTLAYLFTVRWRVNPLALGGLVVMMLFVVLTGPMVLAGGSPYSAVPISGWTGLAITEALRGETGKSLLWLAPSLVFPLLMLPFVVRKG